MRRGSISSLLMLQPCRRNVGLAGLCIGTSEDDGHADDLPTLGKQRWKDIVFGKALTTGLWRLLSMVIGCGSKRILCFSRCTLVDRVKSCISLACALKGLPSGRQALTLTSYKENGHVLDVLVDALRQVGLVLNSWEDKKNLTTQSQPPAELVSPGEIVVENLEDKHSHGWQPRT